MRQIPLRVINEKVPGFPTDIRFDYAETMLSALRAGGVQGLTIDDMSRRLSAIDEIEAAVEDEIDYVLLEEAEHKTLLTLIKAHRFRYVIRSAIQLRDEIEHAASVEVEVKEEL